MSATPIGSSRGVADRIAGSTVRPGGHRALIALPAGVRPQLLYYFSSKFMPDHVAWHAEKIAKGIDDDAQSTRVCSIGRGDGSLAGVGRIGSSVNHRLA